jgi:hypothetical protein
LPLIVPEKVVLLFVVVTKVEVFEVLIVPFPDKLSIVRSLACITKAPATVRLAQVVLAPRLTVAPEAMTTSSVVEGCTLPTHVPFTFESPPIEVDVIVAPKE